MMNNSINPSEQVLSYSEAMATWSVRYTDPTGFQCQLSLQAETGSELLAKAKGALEYLVEAKCLPFHSESPNGNKKADGNNAGPTVLVKPDGNDKNPICPLHSVEMTRWTKNGRSWFAHRWQDGWCSGKLK